MAKTKSGLAEVSIDVLERELRRRHRRQERVAQKLARKHAKLRKQLAALEAQMGKLPGGRGPRRSGSQSPGIGMGASTRARNKKNLVEALAALLKGKTLSVTNAAAEVRKAGYYTTSPNFRTMVNAALLKKKFFKRVGRGEYTSV